MIHESESDPFSAAPRSFSASDDYLTGAYAGPDLPPVHRQCLGALWLGAIGLLASVFFAFSGMMSEFLHAVGRVALFVGPLLAIGAIVLGHVSYVAADRSSLRGKGQAVTGFIFGYASLVIVFIALVLNSDGSGGAGIA